MHQYIRYKNTERDAHTSRYAGFYLIPLLITEPKSEPKYYSGNEELFVFLQDAGEYTF